MKKVKTNKLGLNKQTISNLNSLKGGKPVTTKYPFDCVRDQVGPSDTPTCANTCANTCAITCAVSCNYTCGCVPTAQNSVCFCG